VEVRIIDLGHGLDALHERGKLLELSPLVVYNLVRSQWRHDQLRARTHQRLSLVRAVPAFDDDVVTELWQHVQQLPVRQRETVIRRFYLDSSVSDTAAAMCCTDGTVKATTSHALNNLRVAIAGA
jgi:DNA-directed RNA polymerase specialized sigma24 family protein